MVCIGGWAVTADLVSHDGPRVSPVGKDSHGRLRPRTAAPPFPLHPGPCLLLALKSHAQVVCWSYEERILSGVYALTSGAWTRVNRVSDQGWGS
eukprot:2498706-Rhodomonas_salina.2